MAETAVLNPLRGYDPTVGGSMNPDFSFKKSRTNTRLVKKPTGGTPYDRETQNTGHTYNLQWSNRPRAVMLRLVQFAQQYKSGYFTMYDWEDGGRCYSGRFTGDLTPSPTQNDCWLITATFEEMPTVPMLHYSTDWNTRAVMRYACDDFGDPKTASMIAASGSAWDLTPRPALLANAGIQSPSQSLDTPGAAGDWAAYQYVGYGFRLYMLSAPDGGQYTITLDGNALNNPLVPAGTLVLGGGTPPQQIFDSYAANGPKVMNVLTYPNLPLDFHVVQVTALGTADRASAGTAIRWWALEVMQ